MFLRSRLSIRASIVNLVRLWSLIVQKISCDRLKLEWTFFESLGLFNTSYPLSSKLLTQSPHRNDQVWVLSPYPWAQEYSIDQQCKRSDPHQKYNFPRRGWGVDIKWNELHTKEVILSTQPTLVPWQPQVSQSQVFFVHHGWHGMGAHLPRRRPRLCRWEWRFKHWGIF